MIVSPTLFLFNHFSCCCPPTRSKIKCIPTQLSSAHQFGFRRSIIEKSTVLLLTVTALFYIHGFNSFNLHIFHQQGLFYYFSYPIYKCSFLYSLLTLVFVSHQELNLSAFSLSRPLFLQRCNRNSSKKICSVMTPQQSERKPAATGSVGFLLFFFKNDFCNDGILNFFAV